MEIAELKKQIEKNSLDDRCIVFKCSDGHFIAKQYIEAIAANKSLDILIVDSLEEALTPVDDVFFDDVSVIKVCYVDELINLKEFDPRLKYVYIIADKVKGCTVEIVTVPKLEDWQILDYAYTTIEGVAPEKIDKLVEMCNNSIDRLDKELMKLSIFDKQERNLLFDKFMEDGIFNDLSNHTIFDFVDALLKKDMHRLKSLYEELEQIDCEPMALLVILIKQFKNIILVQLTPKATEDNTGLSSKQIWAINKYNCNFYTRNSLVRIYDLLTSMDLKIKQGEFPMDNRGFSFLLDFLVTQVLTA